jgi:hypothetical protein
MKKSILVTTLILVLAGTTSTQVHANPVESCNRVSEANLFDNGYMPNASKYIALYSADMTKNKNRIYIEYSMGSTLSDNKVYIDLQAKKSDGKWKTIKSWEKSYDRTGFGGSVEHYDSSASEYRAKIKFCACISGVVAESKTISIKP